MFISIARNAQQQPGHCLEPHEHGDGSQFIKFVFVYLPRKTADFYLRVAAVDMSNPPQKLRSGEPFEQKT